MSKETQVQEQQVQNNENEIVVKVDNVEPKPQGPVNLLEVEKTSEMAVDASMVDENTSFKTKSQMNGERFSGSLTYEDVLSQTQELSSLKNEQIDFATREIEMRKEKIEGLAEHLNDLNAKPLSSVDSYANYNLVLNKSVWNYNEIEQRNSKLTLTDFALQTHIYLYDGEIIEVDDIKRVLDSFVDVVAENIVLGYPVILNSALIVDVIRFDKTKILPILIANPKLIPPIGVVEWQSFVKDTDKNRLIISTFIKLLDSALNNGFECEFFPNTVMVRNVSGITSLFVSEQAAVWFNSSIRPKSPKNKE